MLYYRKSGRTQKVIMKKNERDMVLQEAHIVTSQDGAASHADSEAMLAAIEPRYKWPHIKLDSDDWVCVFHLYFCLAF